MLLVKLTTQVNLTKPKKSNATAIVVGVLVPIAVIALLVGGVFYVLRKKPHLFNRLRRRYMPHFDNNYTRSSTSEPLKLLNDNQKSYDSGIELKMAQIIDD